MLFLQVVAAVAWVAARSGQQSRLLLHQRLCQPRQMRPLLALLLPAAHPLAQCRLRLLDVLSRYRPLENGHQMLPDSRRRVSGRYKSFLACLLGWWRPSNLVCFNDRNDAILFHKLAHSDFIASQFTASITCERYPVYVLLEIVWQCAYPCTIESPMTGTATVTSSARSATDTCSCATRSGCCTAMCATVFAGAGAVSTDSVDDNGARAATTPCLRVAARSTQEESRCMMVAQVRVD